jgi:RNA polymerase sigma-70 factor (ECF subfamily)
MSPAQAGGGLLTAAPRRARAYESSEAKADERLSRAFNEVRGVLFAKLHYLLANHEDAQDALQVTFLHCWQARRRLAAVRNLESWILRVGLNAGKDLLRNGWHRRARPMNPLLAPPCPSPSAEEILVDRERMERLRVAILNLPLPEREVFLLRQHTALPYEDIARLLGTPVGTVKTRMRSALRRLRQALQQD